MSSAGILAQIQALQAKIAALKEAIRHLNNASSSFSFSSIIIVSSWYSFDILNGIKLF